MRLAIRNRQPIYSASTKHLLEPFVREVSQAFHKLEMLAPNGQVQRDAPSQETVEWAKQILLRVLPPALLIGAEINAFQHEIHVTWESETRGKRVVVFFPAPDQLKIYHERLENDAVVEHQLVNAIDPSAISDRLRWFFQ